MTTILEKISNLNDLVLQGKALEAFEKYYHEDIVMQENENLPTFGKAGNRKREMEYFLLWIAISVFLAVSGGGKLSIDKDIILKK